MTTIKNLNPLARTLLLALAATGSAVLATSCADDTLTSGSTAGDADGSLRVVSLTLDGRELAATATGSRAVYDTYTGTAWTNSAGLVDVNEAKQCSSNQPNRIITGFSSGDAMLGLYSLDGTNTTYIYLYCTGNDEWEIRSFSAKEIGEAKTIRPNAAKGESWGNFLVKAQTYATPTEIAINDAPHFPVKCVMNADRLGVGCEGSTDIYSFGYAHSAEWKANYSKSTNTDNPYTDNQAGRMPTTTLAGNHPGAYHVGTADEDRGALTLNLVHSQRALLTLADADITVSGWPQGYNTIATLRADQMSNNTNGFDVKDDSGESYSNYRPVFSRVSENAAGTKLRWQTIALAKTLSTGSYGDGTTESYGYCDRKAENDKDKSYTLTRLHVRLCKKDADGNVIATSEEFEVPLGGTEGIEMRENHSYRLALTLTPSHLSAATLSTFPTWAGETVMEGEDGGEDGYTTSTDADGKETWSIYTAQGLVAFRDKVNDGNTALNAILMKDIDLSSVCSSSLDSWNPIGNSNKSYAGTFNGQHHTIKNLYIRNTSFSQGLFGIITNGAEIRNIKLENPHVSGAQDIGSLIASINGNGEVNNNITVSGNTVSGTILVYAINNNAGGLIGYATGSNVYIYGNTVSGISTGTDNKVSAQGFAGGIIGSMASGNVGIMPDGTLKANTVSGTLAIDATTVSNAGGIIGYMTSGKVSGNIVNSSGVTITTDGYNNAGGIIGLMEDGTASGNFVKGSTAIVGSGSGTLVGNVSTVTLLTTNTVAKTVTVNGVTAETDPNFVGSGNTDIDASNKVVDE